MQDNSDSYFNRVTNLSKRFLQRPTFEMTVPTTSNPQNLPEPVLAEINDLKAKISELEKKQTLADYITYYLMIVCMLMAFVDFWKATTVYSYCTFPVLLIRLGWWFYENRHKNWKQIGAEWEEEITTREREDKERFTQNKQNTNDNK